MSYIKDYIDGDYEITQYTTGGAIRERLSGKIVAEYTNYWTGDGSINQATQKQLEHIKEKLGIEIII